MCLRSSVAALLAAGVLTGCHCGCPASSAHEWQSDDRAYRSAGPPPRAEAMADDEADLHAKYGKVEAIKAHLGKAAYYGKSLAGNKTASGEIFDPEKFTAAHRTLPFGTIVRVVRLDNGAHTYVRINDRGPFGDRKRIIDVAEIAAKRLDMLDLGVIDVRVEVLRYGDGRRKSD